MIIIKMRKQYCKYHNANLKITLDNFDKKIDDLDKKREKKHNILPEKQSLQTCSI